VAQSAMKKDSPPEQPPEPGDSHSLPRLQDYRDSVYTQAEKQYLQDLMALAGKDMEEACRKSGLSQSRLYALLKKQGISVSHPD
jgi:two-component system, NtrC family, response regulator